MLVVMVVLAIHILPRLYQIRFACAPEAVDEPESMECCDYPFGGVPVYQGRTGTVVVREGVMLWSNVVRDRRGGLRLM